MQSWTGLTLDFFHRRRKQIDLITVISSGATGNQMSFLTDANAFLPVSSALVSLQLAPGNTVCWSMLFHKPLQEQSWTQLLLASRGIACEYNAGIIRCWQPCQNNKIRWKVIPVNIFSEYPVPLQCSLNTTAQTHSPCGGMVVSLSSPELQFCL